MVVDAFSNQMIPLQGNKEDWEPYYKHWETMYRINEWEEAERQGKINYVYTSPFRWESSTGEDHWAHATTYWLVGMERFGKGTAGMFTGEKISFPESQAISDDKTWKAPNPLKTFDLPINNQDDWRNLG